MDFKQIKYLLPAMKPKKQVGKRARGVGSLQSNHITK